MEDKIIEAVRKFKPLSVFLYGSRGRGDYHSSSDYEVGLIFEDEKIVKRRLLHQEIQLDSVRVYPFKLTDIISGQPKTPFLNEIYVYELIIDGKTIFGKRVIENLKLPNITTLSLMRSIRFEIGVAFMSVLSQRAGDVTAVSSAMSKSCLFGLRLLIILKTKQFLTGYYEIYQAGKKLELDSQYQEFIDEVYFTYLKRQKLHKDRFFDNLNFLCHIESEIMTEFENNGILKFV